MAEPTETTEAEPAPSTPPKRGTTGLSRVSGALAWFVAAWFLFFGYGYAPLLVAGVVLVWLGTGAWRGRRRRTIALAAFTALAAVYYPVAGWWRWNHRRGEFAEFSYPGLWITMLAIQSAVLLTIAVTALLSLRRPADQPSATAEARSTNQP
jgi:hypothetical protein